MSTDPCKRCGKKHTRLGAMRPEYFARILRVLNGWRQTAQVAIGLGRPTAATVEYVRSHLMMLLADDQGLCILCVDHAVVQS